MLSPFQIVSLCLFAGSPICPDVLLSSYRPPSFTYLGLAIVRSFLGFPPSTMISADFLQFVVTTHFFEYIYFMRLQDSPGKREIFSQSTCPIYVYWFRVVIGLQLS